MNLHNLFIVKSKTFFFNNYQFYLFYEKKSVLQAASFLAAFSRWGRMTGNLKLFTYRGCLLCDGLKKLDRIFERLLHRT